MHASGYVDKILLREIIFRFSFKTLYLLLGCPLFDINYAFFPQDICMNRRYQISLMGSSLCRRFPSFLTTRPGRLTLQLWGRRGATSSKHAATTHAPSERWQNSARTSALDRHKQWTIVACYLHYFADITKTKWQRTRLISCLKSCGPVRFSSIMLQAMFEVAQFLRTFIILFRLLLKITPLATWSNVWQ